MDTTLSLCMISKDGEKKLKKLIPLVKPYVNEIVVVIPPGDSAKKYLKSQNVVVIEEDFTQSIEPEIVEQMKGYGVDISPDYRLFNFAAARNRSFEHATKSYCIWLDDDDKPVGIETISEFIAKNPQTDRFNAIYDYSRDADGNREADHIRERVIKNNNKFEWRGSKLGLIHETLILKESKSALELDFPSFRVEHQSDHMQESSNRNFIALLYEYIKTEGEDPRNTFYLGIEFFNRKDFGKSVAILRDFVQKSGSQEDRYQAHIKIGEALHLINEPALGRHAYYQAIDEMPNYPTAYLSLGESYHNEENWAKCIDFTLTGLGKKPPGTKHGRDMSRFTFRPAVFLALSYLQLGKPMDAYKWFETAYSLNPKNEWVQNNVQLFQDAKDLSDYVSSFVKLGQLSQRLYPKTLSKLAEAVPDELIDQELLMDFKWRYTRPKVWPDNSVVFFCSSAFEDWGPESLIKGCGGSEEAIIQLSKRLVKLGWDVTVYNNCFKEAVVDGVKWVRFEKFNPRDVFDVIVGWRNNPFIDPKVARRKFIDMHDVVTNKEYYADELLKNVKVLVKSQFHRTTLPDLPDDKFVIIPNGIDTKQFDSPKKIKNNLCWTSSYDRGLEHLLEMWPEIKKEVPDATLDVAYGWNLYDTTPWGKKPSGQAWKKKMQDLMLQDGITDHGRLGNNEVAELYKKADVFAYPSSFPEICMISLTKAMAAECVPIATETGSVKERNQGVVVKGDINNPAVREEFKNELIALLKDEKRKNEIRSSLNTESYSWDEIARRWDEVFKA